MKKDQYIPHDVSMRNNAEVFNMVESEGAAGYGLYWAILEYLRSQNNYRGNTNAIKGIARQMKCRYEKANRVLKYYGLFVIDDTTFFSLHLNEKMQPLENKRAQKSLSKQADEWLQNGEHVSKTRPTVSKKRISLSKPSHNSLIINHASDKVKESIGKERKEETSSPISSSSAEAVAEAAPVFHESWTASRVMSACWATKGRSFRPVRRSVTSASTSTRVVLPSNAYGRNCTNPSTKGHINTKITILPQASAAIAGCRYRPMLRQGRMCKRCGVM